MQIALNKSRSSRDRYYLVNKSMGCYGLPEDAPDHKYSVINGIDRGNGFQGGLSIKCALTECKYFPEDAKHYNLAIALIEAM